ncbi:TPA: hypothetical protein HA265_04020 [Candidatus Woesearchaeota archaeon]|nr:hypothetical protein [Candidatus Woesearchaeota archaeon]
MSMRSSKKGLSPLIAAVLLIVVVVGIGAVVTGIVRNYVTESKQTITEKSSDIKCGVEVDIEVPVVSEEMQICHDSVNNIINFTLENTGTATIDEIQIKFFGTSGFEAIDELSTNGVAIGTWGTGMAAGETLKFNATYDSGAVGTLQQVNIIPRVKVVGRTDEAYCTDSSLKFTDINACT